MAAEPTVDVQGVDWIDVALDDEAAHARVDAAEGDDLAAVLPRGTAIDFDALDVDGGLGGHQAFLMAWTIAVRS